MPIMVTVTFPLKDGQAAGFLELLNAALPDTRAYAGCIDVKTFAEESGAHVLLVEEWETKTHQEAYLAWRVETGLLEAIAPFISGDPQFGFYEIRPE